MGAQSIFEILTSFGQYTGIVSSVRIPWPDSWKPILQYVNYLRLDFMSQFEGLNVPQVDARAQYILLANAFPLAMAILLLILFKSIKVVLWYVLLLFSIGLLLAGAVLKLVPTSNFLGLSSNIPDVFLIAGGSNFGLLLLIGIVNYMCTRCKKNKVHPQNKKSSKDGSETEEKDESESSESDMVSESEMERQKKDKDDEQMTDSDDEHEEEDEDPEQMISHSKIDLDKIASATTAKRKGFWLMMRNLLIGIVFLVVGFLSLNIITVPQEIAVLQNGLMSLGRVVGWIFFAIGAFFLINFILNTFTKGREFLTSANNFMKKNALSLTLLLLALVYIPISTSILSMVNCRSYTCEQGTRFPIVYSPLSLDAITSSFTQNTTGQALCEACTFEGQCSIKDKLCPRTSDRRLVEEIAISCQDIFKFYTPGAVMMAISFMLGVPYLFYRIIFLSTKVVRQIPVEEANEVIKWKEQVRISNNSCKTLYSMFEWDWRYYKLIMILQKLLVVSIFIFARDIPIIMVATLAIIQTVFLFLTLVSRPYIRRLEDTLSITCCFVSAVNAIVAFLIALHDNQPNVFPYVIPDVIIYPLGALNIILPILVIIVMAYYEYKELRQLNRKESDTASASKDDKQTKKPVVEKTATIRNDPSIARDAGSKEVIVDKKTQERRIRRLAKVLDTQLDKLTLSVIVNFFLFMGVTAYLSLGIVFIGIVLQAQSSNVIEGSYRGTSTTSADIAKFEFAGYSSWTEFTTNCCCRNTTLFSPRYYEEWSCSNNIIKMRLRADANVNGLSYRSFCSKTFSPSVCNGPLYDSSLSSSSFSISLCPGIPAPANPDALTKYW